jgi:Rieske Fe-S protein
VSTSVTRRGALTGAAVAVVGGLLGFVYGRHSDAAKGTGGADSYGYSSGALIARLADLRPGSGVIAHGVVVTRTGEAVHAFSSRCTHLGCTVNRVSGGKIFCPCHGSVFDATTGRVLESPATAPLPSVPVVVRDGGVYLS